MSTDRELLRLERCLDEGCSPPPALEHRLASDMRLRRSARALRRVDALLRAELGAAGATRHSPSFAPRVMAALDERPAPAEPGGSTWCWVAAAAAAVLLTWTLIPGRDPDPPSGPTRPTTAWVPRLLQQVPIAPEQALVTEGKRLVEDSRQVARTLWSQLPLSIRWPHASESGG